jgi:hypothetical protein
LFGQNFAHLQRVNFAPPKVVNDIVNGWTLVWNYPFGDSPKRPGEGR